jgi:predicted nucleic acid-binding protein
LPDTLNHTFPERLGTPIERLIKALLETGTFIETVQEVYHHPIDDDDSCYVNLALTVGAELIVSRDRHLLNLVNPAKTWSDDFRRRFPTFLVLQPEQYLEARKARGLV